MIGIIEGGRLMIMINGNWEQVKDLSDVLRIVSENIGSEFAQKVEEICGEPSLELEEQNFMLTNEIDNLNDRHKYIRKLFIEVLGLANDFLKNDEYDEFLEEFDYIWNGYE